MDIDHFDPWWNLTVEDQATDRTHGIGQSNIVEIIDMAEETSLCHSLFI
jgi:SNF2 family DNA or RNA helicase